MAPGFIEKHGLWTDDQGRQAKALLARIEQDGIRNIRIGWGDQHGIIRGKTVTAAEFASCLRSGKDFQLVTAILYPFDLIMKIPSRIFITLPLLPCSPTSTAVASYLYCRAFPGSMECGKTWHYLVSPYNLVIM